MPDHPPTLTDPPLGLRQAYTLLFAVLPWSLVGSFGSWTMQIPSEPILAVLGFGLAGQALRYPALFYRSIRGNKLLFFSALWIIWLAISAACSTMPLVSWKYWVVEAGQWWVFAAGLALFPSLWQRLVRTIILSMALLIVYTLFHHALYDFRADQSLLAPMPFFPDHTLYAAVLAMLLPWLVFLYRDNPRKVFGALALLFAAGLWFAFCRAALLSVFTAGIVFFVLHFRKHSRWLALAGILGLATAFIFQTAINGAINRKIAADVSTLERLNRYDCARQMGQERPRTGFGPGTFQFQYLPYQRPEKMTRISVPKVSADRDPGVYGRGGGAHSEYWQALSETGLPGFFIYVLWISAFLWMALACFLRTELTKDQGFILACLLSLLTFFVHGLFNNMLHDGRIAALVWGQAAVLGSRKSLLKFDS